MDTKTPESTAHPPWWLKPLQRPGWVVFITLLLLLVGFGTRFGWRYYRMRQIETRIRNDGGGISFDRIGPDWIHENLSESVAPFLMVPSRVISTGTAEFDDQYFQENIVPLNDYHGLTHIHIFNPQISSESLQELGRFNKLKALWMEGQSVNDDVMEHIKSLPRLERLALDGTEISDEGLRHLQQMTTLEQLSVSNTDVTEQGVEELQKHLPLLDVSDD